MITPNTNNDNNFNNRNTQYNTNDCTTRISYINNGNNNNHLNNPLPTHHEYNHNRRSNINSFRQQTLGRGQSNVILERYEQQGDISWGHALSTKQEGIFR